MARPSTDHSFEGYTAGQQTMGRFQSLTFVELKGMTFDAAGNVLLNDHQGNRYWLKGRKSEFCGNKVTISFPCLLR